ncbi:DeoR/GlpR family DNA-binding transcription regulator [Lacticaseibacillus paracasei]|uniref:DeoR/GlpR family DNA-binding transcription regulator n=1 Tax=Lacticaseibacillus paracasei TaxID=1597 RepID=UPI0021D387EF|nr:DeoR/GlpR family DNA-binding transcription regulator [Lacticaseibacillus paracasei]MCU6430240.1 DeoR/GlpR family DNA-binding transcription regulator [Lacticaseibacillus paracasei]
MYQQQRISQILEELAQTGAMSTQAIMARFDISRETARRDILFMTQRNLAERTHGGIMSHEGPAAVIDYVDRRDQQAAGKQAIGAAAAIMVQPKMTLYLDVSTTVVALTQRLDVPVTVYTPSIDNANALLANPKVELHMVGGRFDPNNRFFYDAANADLLKSVKFDIAFFGAASAEKDGFYVREADGAALKQLIIPRSRQRVMLMDHTKFGKQSSQLAALPTQLTGLVTDEPIPPAIAKAWPDQLTITVAEP